MAAIPLNVSESILAKYSLDREKKCFSYIQKDTVQDKIEIELGDSKNNTDFLPQFKFMRWDNEVNFSVRLKDFTNYTLTTEEEIIKLVNNTQEVNLYDLNGDKYEFEVILKEKPQTNKIEFTLNTKGLDFFYQPELTQEEINEGKNRPENVVGSYAIYTSENKFNLVDGKEYKNGKVGHIFRPQMIDSEGNKIWGELNIDVENGILSVIIPQDFLNKAVYPIRHATGLTFGNTNTGASSINFSAGTLAGIAYTSPNGANKVESLTASVNTDSGTSNIKGVLILNSTNGILDGGVGSAGAVTTTKEWITSTLSSPVNITKNTSYLLSIVAQDATVNLYYDSATGGNVHYDATNSYDTPTNPDGTDAFNSNRYSVYATYSLQVGILDVACIVSADDGWWSEGDTGFNNSGATLNFGYINGTLQRINSFIRFLNITIPKGAIINTCYLTFKAHSTLTLDSVNIRISAIDEDSASAPTTYAGAEGATRTTANVSYTLPDWTGSTLYNSEDLSTVLKEIVDRDGWASGQNVVFYVEDNNSTATDNTYRNCKESSTVDSEVNLYATYTTVSESLSPSLSPSLSTSLSPSLSESLSPSTTSAISASLSPSLSASLSESLSPSLGYERYTRGDYVNLPADDTDLETNYSAQDYIDVNDNNNVRVSQSAAAQYSIHQFKDFVGENTQWSFEWEGQSSLAPSVSKVVLQIYDRVGDVWVDIDEENGVGANTDFILSGSITLDADNYKDDSNVISCRVYQQGT